MRELERILDRGGFTGTFDPQKMGFEWITQFLMVGLKHGDPKFGATLNPEKIDDMIQEFWIEADRTLADLINLLMDGMRVSGVLASKEEKEKNVQPTVEAPAG
jgi:hypothetical protein